MEDKLKRKQLGMVRATETVMKVTKLGDLTKPIILFASDAQNAEDILDSDDTQYKRRTFVRALFAMIEGTVYFLKQTTLSTGLSNGKLSVSDMLLLQDATPELRQNGETCIKTKFIPIDDNLKFVIRMLKQVYEINISLGQGSSAWQDFQAAISIRNKITHPKSESDFLISDKDVETMRRVRSWFCEIIADAVKRISSFSAAISAHKSKSEVFKSIH